ncbi:hypothetical protein N6G95_08635 [Pediococcus inopinatus]|uniref:hypothetical protein n=1 Tax=Pediococcus inopinatus TaxID=114090 RepID=UPI002B25BD3B|nr:hypothetical protein [Pediococcus inopinatus]WPC19288.1 hypothetical protein N6G95_08635 [Pediococcus inopinatus]
MKNISKTTKLRNRITGFIMLAGSLSTIVVAQVANAATGATDDGWGTSSDDKAVTTTADSNGKTINLVNQLHSNYGDEVTYPMYFTFPNNEKMTTAGFLDNLPDGITYKDVKIYHLNKTISSSDDLKGLNLKTDATDVTSSGTTDKQDNGFKFTFKNASDTFGQSYAVMVTATMDADGTANLTKYADANGVIKIPNTAHQFWNDTDKPTPTPVVIPPKTVTPTTDKKIVGADGKLVDNLQVDFNKTYHYAITNNAGSNTQLDKIVSTDDLEDVINLEGVTVHDGSSVTGKDISSQFDIAIDKDKESFTITPKVKTDWANKEWTIDVSGKLQNTAKLMDYLKNGIPTVPNKATLNINSKIYTTPTVTVTVPKISNNAQKYIEQSTTSSSTSKSTDSSSNASNSSSSSSSSAKTVSTSSSSK